MLTNGYVNSYRGTGLCYSQVNTGYDDESHNSFALRPVVVLSSEIPYSDATIGNYYTYTGGGSGSSRK